MMSKQVSHYGPCVVWAQCMPSKFSQQRKRAVMTDMQNKWLDAHDVFMSEGRVYSDIVIHDRPFIMDAITGTLFFSSGRCMSTQDLNVNIKDRNYNKVDVVAFVREKY